MAFCDIFGAMSNAEQYVKHIVNYTMSTCPTDLEFFNKFVDTSLLDRLHTLVSAPFQRVSYRDAIVLLQTEIAKDPSKWNYTDVKFGTDLQVCNMHAYVHNSIIQCLHHIYAHTHILYCICIYMHVD